MLQQRDEKERLRQAIAVGLKQLERGESIPGEQVYEEMRRRSEEHRRASNKGA